MKVYSTNDGLGYRELAYFMKVPEGWLCVALDVRDEVDACGYRVGKLEKDDFIGIYECNYDIKNSPLYDTYLFNYFLKQQPHE